MDCPHCQHKKTKICRTTNYGYEVERYHQCTSCKRYFFSVSMIKSRYELLRDAERKQTADSPADFIKAAISDLQRALNKVKGVHS